MNAYEVRVMRLPRWAVPLIFIVALGMMALAFVIGLGLFLVAIPVALIAALLGRLSTRQSRGLPSGRRGNSRNRDQVIDAEYEVVEDRKR